MLKRMSLKKILVCSLALFSLSLLHFLPNNDLRVKQTLKYVDNPTNIHPIYLENNDHYLTKVSVSIKSTTTEKKIRELIDKLINNKINNFKSVLNKKTKINSVKYNDGVLKIDFNNELLNVKKNKEEKVIESLIYTLTSIDEVNYIIIYINGELLTYLPKSKITLPSTLDRSFGINKEYNITSSNNISKTTIYYLSSYYNQDYYIPVTKVNNDTRDKIEIIVEELSNNITNNKLMSYLNSNTKLISSNQEEDKLSLVFNKYIINDYDEQNILPEVINSICMSINDNYDIKTVSFIINNQEINKTDLKSLE